MVILSKSNSNEVDHAVPVMNHKKEDELVLVQVELVDEADTVLNSTAPYEPPSNVDDFDEEDGNMPPPAGNNNTNNEECNAPTNKAQERSSLGKGHQNGPGLPPPASMVVPPPCVEKNTSAMKNNDTYQGRCMEVGLFKCCHGWKFLVLAGAVIVVLAAIVTVAAAVLPPANRGDNKSSTPSEFNAGNLQSSPSISPSAIASHPPSTQSMAPTNSPPQPTGGPSSEPSRMPTANHAPVPSMAPTTSYARTVNVISFLQDLTLSSSPLRYPAPEGSATAEEKALAWILDADPAQLGVETEENQHRLVQRYALATLWSLQDTQEPWNSNARVVVEFFQTHGG